MSETDVTALLDTGSMTVRNIRCRGTCRHRSAEECTVATHLVYPYRGVYLRHVGREQVLADANHVLLFHAGQSYQVSHPVTGGDECLDISLSPELLGELMADSQPMRQQQRIDAHAQGLLSRLRHHLQDAGTDSLSAENLLLSLVSHSLASGSRSRVTRVGIATHGRRRLVDRVKLLLAGDLSRRWSLTQIGAAIGASPVYLTQVFAQVEGLPLYRYQLQLRLARALDLIAQYEDLSALASDLGFSSHSHFSAAFRRAYGRAPSHWYR